MLHHISDSDRIWINACLTVDLMKNAIVALLLLITPQGELGYEKHSLADWCLDECLIFPAIYYPSIVCISSVLCEEQNLQSLILWVKEHIQDNVLAQFVISITVQWLWFPDENLPHCHGAHLCDLTWYAYISYWIKWKHAAVSPGKWNMAFFFFLPSQS